MLKLYRTIPAALLVFLAYVAFTSQNNQRAIAGEAAETNPEALELGLETLRALRMERKEYLDRIAQEIKHHVDAGRKTMNEYRNAKIALLLAEIELSENPDRRISLYQEVVQLHQETEMWAMKRVEQGKVGKEELDKLKVATVEAKIGLLTMVLKQDGYL